MRKYLPVLFFLCAVPAWGATYYMRADGTASSGSPPTAPGPCGTVGNTLSVANHNASTFSAGDTIYLCDDGGDYEAQLTVPSSGSDGSPITYSAASGDNPVFDGSTIISTWTGGNTDYTQHANMQAYWMMEEGDSQTRLDGTANNNDLANGGSVIQSATAHQGTYSAEFAKADAADQLTISNANMSASMPGKQSYSYPDVTMGAWVYLASLPGGGVSDGIMGYYDRLTITLNGNQGGKADFTIRDDGGTYYTARSNAAISTAGWVHIVARWQGSVDDEMSIWVNGSKQTNTNTSVDAPMVDSAAGFAVGNNSGLTRWVDGLIDEAFVMNAALSDAQILELYTYGLDGGGGATNLWSASLASTPSQVLFDSTWGIPEAGTCPDDLDTDKEWCYDSDGDILYQYSTSDPDTRYTSPGTEAILRYNIANTGGHDYITFDGIDSTKGAYGYYLTTGGTYNIIQNSEISWNRFDAIIFNGAGSYYATINGNTIHDNYRHGISGLAARDLDITNNTSYNHNESDGSGLYDGGINMNQGGDVLIDGNTTYNNFYGIKTVVSDNTIVSNNTDHDSTSFCIDLDTQVYDSIAENNTVYNCGSHGIVCEIDSDRNIIRYNTVHDAGSSQGGITLNQCDNTEVYYNVIYDSYDGIKVYLGQNNTVYNNTIYNMAHDGIVMFAGTGTNLAKNNIVHTTGGVYGIFGSETGDVCSYNITYNVASAINCVSESNNIEATDPLMVAPESGDFSLSPGSPARWAGTHIWGIPYVDVYGKTLPRTGTPSLGAVEVGTEITPPGTVR